jgi:phenylacetate-CoA ligase
MNKLFEKIYYNSPDFVQNLAVTLFDFQYYKKRSGNYKKLKEFYNNTYLKPRIEQERIQSHRLKEFLRFVARHSTYYKKQWENVDIERINKPEDMRILPVINKEELRNHINEIRTVKPSKSYVAHTGGTTGKSLTVYFNWEDTQERMAVLDSFREMFGYRLGKKIAWFSGKTILNKRDENRNRFWKTDIWFNIRYYSTFHITDKNLPHYIKNLNIYKPEYFSGFPSSIFEIAKYMRRNNLKPNFHLKTIFTTAETLMSEQVKIIEEQFGTRVIDHYSSSEGAPWIVQCEFGKYHFLLENGVIEIIDENGKPAEEGEILVTSFGTKGTPLVRYRIGDRIKMARNTPNPCRCGSFSPVVKKIEGRVNDFLYSKERGKINLGNVSNCVKYAEGVLKFQAKQESLGEINVNLVVDPSLYSKKNEMLIKKEFKDRLGEKIKIYFKYVDDIDREKSGKHMIVKNKINRLLK